MTTSAPIIIHYYQFSVTQPYSPGPYHLSPEEAAALNSLRSDLIRQSAAHWVRAAEAAPEMEGLLSPSQLVAIQQSINELEARFKFRLRNGTERKSLLQKEREAIYSSLSAQTFEAKPTIDDLERTARRRITARSEAFDPDDLGI